MNITIFKLITSTDSNVTCDILLSREDLENAVLSIAAVVAEEAPPNESIGSIIERFNDSGDVFLKVEEASLNVPFSSGLRELLSSTQESIEDVLELLTEPLEVEGKDEDEINNRPEIMALSGLLVPLEEAKQGNL